MAHTQQKAAEAKTADNHCIANYQNQIVEIGKIFFQTMQDLFGEQMTYVD